MVAGVVGEDVVAECRAVEVDVDLGCGYAFVAEHLLYGAQVGASFEQMGGEGVTQGVGRDGLAYAGGGGEVFDYLEYAHAGHASATAVQKEYVAAVRLDVKMHAVHQIVADL